MRGLRVGNSLVFGDVIIVRNVFLLFLEGYSPNGGKWGDSREVAEVLGAVCKGRPWPHVIYGEDHHLGRFITRFKEEPRNFYYSYCRIKLRPWVALGSTRVKSGPYVNFGNCSY